MLINPDNTKSFLYLEEAQKIAKSKNLTLMKTGNVEKEKPVYNLCRGQLKFKIKHVIFPMKTYYYLI